MHGEKGEVNVDPATAQQRKEVSVRKRRVDSSEVSRRDSDCATNDGDSSSWKQIVRVENERLNIDRKLVGRPIDCVSISQSKDCKQPFTEMSCASEGRNGGDSTLRKASLDVGSAEWRKQTAIAAANARHSRPGGSRAKREQIRQIWASGKYSSRDICAEQESAALGMSFKAARNALVNTPDPEKR